MNLKHSSSLLLVWRVAEFEARQAKASMIEPTHLLLGLCKVVDLDLPELISKDAPDRNEMLKELMREVRRLRTIFQNAGLDAKNFRRKLRRLLPERRFAMTESELLHRSPSSKEIFLKAEQFAQICNEAVFPVQLLHAILMSCDTERDTLLLELRIDKACFIGAVKNEVFSRVSKSLTTKSDLRVRWN